MLSTFFHKWKYVMGSVIVVILITLFAYFCGGDCKMELVGTSAGAPTTTMWWCK